MRKWKFFINFELEEKWLNDMAKQGFTLIKKSFFYEFQPAKPEDALIKIDYRTFNKKEDFEDYLALFEDSGWQHISGTKSSGYQYFKKIEANGSDDIFSDVNSKASRYKRLSNMWMSLALSFFPILVALISTDSIDVAALVNPKFLYYTPGLWEKTGATFWRAFLFETPFALFRGIIWVFFPLMIFLYVLFAYKADRQYKRTQQNDN